MHVSSESTMDAVPSTMLSTVYDVAVNVYDPWADNQPVHVSSASTMDTAMDTAMLQQTTKEEAEEASGCKRCSYEG